MLRSVKMSTVLKFSRIDFISLPPAPSLVAVRHHLLMSQDHSRNLPAFQHHLSLFFIEAV